MVEQGQNGEGSINKKKLMEPHVGRLLNKFSVLWQDFTTKHSKNKCMKEQHSKLLSSIWLIG